MTRKAGGNAASQAAYSTPAQRAKKGSKRKKQKTGLNRSMLDVGIGMLKEAIKYKAGEAGALYLEAPTRSLKPTQRCAVCWRLTRKTLSDQLHVCSNKKCNHSEDRDVNAAQVCLSWARGLERASSDGDGSSSTENPKGLGARSHAGETPAGSHRKYCGGFQQLAQAKRQKLAAQRSVAE